MLDTSSWAPLIKNFASGAIFAGLLMLAPAKSSATTVTFDLSVNPEDNFPTYTNTSGGLTLTIDNPVATSNQFPAAGELNSAPTGLCAFAVVGTAGGRCNYMSGTIPTGNKFTGFRMRFSDHVILNSFEMSRLRFAANHSIVFVSGGLFANVH
jgi:hypothetical protein